MGKKPNPEFLGKAKDIADEIESLKSTRKGITASITSQYEMLESMGINREAAKAAIKRVQLTPEKKVAFDLSYQIMCQALGEPIQIDLFEEGLKAEIKEKTKHWFFFGLKNKYRLS